MKIACLQFSPELGQFDRNMKRADGVIAISNLPPNLDWLVLPELAFSGYNFPSLAAITPFLEPTAAGPSTSWAIQTAARFSCAVTVGYPEITRPSNPNEPPQHFNSTVTVSPTGQILANYRKTFLYYTDETWASEGPSKFFSGQLGTLGNVTLGICMDINPYRFLAPWTDYEFANTALATNSPIVCVSMAWISRLEPDELMQNRYEPDTTTLTYWIERFQPLMERVGRDGKGPVIVVLANRSGMEGEVCYAGSSTVLRFEGGGVSLYETAGRSEERCLVVDLNERPRFMVRAEG
ncbi:N-terminal asparagine amidohydrolase-like protein [Glonium stellatum]|uniref:N-terminal asparagine amidohydrolase-like protein n=1 Tax=Glonium stellatum TaxID=574774 RepID=A0A8E2JLC2_9PEZI|nr:N-terminal asparagine amidohydrolase-like protein [Glonium stellatum]